MKRSSRGLLLVAGFTTAGLIWMLPAFLQSGGLLFWRGARYSDLLISHWPNALFIQKSIRTWGQIPLWNPTILSGQPFLADPLSAVWYPVSWFAMIIPTAATFNVLFLLHLVWAGLGTYKLARLEGLDPPGAVFAGVAFSGTPKLLGHIGLGHVSLVYAVCWTPWLLWFLKSWTETWDQERIATKWAAGVGASTGLIFLIDPRWLIPSIVAGMIYLGSITAHRHRFLQDFKLVRVKETLIAGLFALGISAGLAIPLVEFNARSTRADLSYEEQVRHSASAEDLFGMAVPDFRVTPELQAYVGVGVVVLAFFGCITNPRRTAVWWILVLLGWGFALGDRLFLHRFLHAGVPFASSLRVPSRYLFLASIGFAFAAGIGLGEFLNWIQNPKSQQDRSWKLILAVFVPIAIFAGWRTFQPSDGSSTSDQVIFILVFGTLSLLALLLWLGISRRVNLSRLGIWIPALLLIELTFFHAFQLEGRALIREPFGDIMDQVSSSSSEIRPRLFSPSYGVPQLDAVEAGWQLADGVNPLILQETWDFMAAATGFDPEGYSVTLPPFPEGSPDEPWNAALDLDALGLLTIGYVLSRYPLDSPGLKQIPNPSDIYLYSNPDVRPRAWIQNRLDSSSTAWKAVERLSWTPNRIEIEAHGPGFLVLSEVFYPGWSVRVNGTEAEIQQAFGLLRAVRLRDRAQEVVFEYRPGSIFTGLGVTFASIVGLVWLWRRS